MNETKEELLSEIIINDIHNPEILIKEIKEKILSRSSKSYNLNFIFAKS